MNFLRIFLVKDEWAPAYLDNPQSFVNRLLGNKTGDGWADKAFHIIKHIIIVSLLCILFQTIIIIKGTISLLIVTIPLYQWTAFWIGVLIGVLYEMIVDCWWQKHGFSLYDIAANTIGDLIGLI